MYQRYVSEGFLLGWGPRIKGDTPFGSLAAHQLSIQACLFSYKTMFLFYTRVPPASPHISTLALKNIPQKDRPG